MVSLKAAHSGPSEGARLATTCSGACPGAHHRQGGRGSQA